MASNEKVSYFSEWECDEENEESEVENLVGEEASRGLTRNEEAWKSCDKLKTDPNYHKRYIPLREALTFRDSSSEGMQTFIKDKELTEQDKMFLSSEKAMKCLQRFSDAVVCITVTLRKLWQASGTGFFVQVNNEDAVITNSHSIRSNGGGDGINFRVVKHSNIQVTFFYDGTGSLKVIRKVDRIEMVSLPDKNKDQNVSIDFLKNELNVPGAKDSEDIRKCNAALEAMSSYFSRKDAFLDYALLYLETVENGKGKDKFAGLQPLEMKGFEKLENFRNVSSFGIPDPRSSRYPRSLRLFTISHPHRASKRVSFGGMESDLTHVFFLNMAYGQNDLGMLNGKDPFVEHSVATCKGSSGAPIFVYIFNHDTGEVEVDEVVYFLHFYGDLNGRLHGKAVSFSTIIKNLQHQGSRNELAEAFAEVGKHVEEP